MGERCPFFIKIYKDFGLCGGTPKRCGGKLERAPHGESIYEDYLCGRTGLVLHAQRRTDPSTGRTETSYQVVRYGRR